MDDRRIDGPLLLIVGFLCALVFHLHHRVKDLEQSKPEASNHPASVADNPNGLGK